MKIISHTKWKYLLPLPVVVLALNAVYFKWVMASIDDTLLANKFIDLTDKVEIVAQSVEAFARTDNGDGFVADVGAIATYLDAKPQLYFAAYIESDDGCAIISQRISEQKEPFDPFMYAEFCDLIAASDSGNISLYFEPRDANPRTMRVHFQWVDTTPASRQRFLIVAGASVHSIEAPMSEWVTWGQVVSMAVTFALETWLVVLLAHIGKGGKNE